jgi:uncharacterized protein
MSSAPIEDFTPMRRPAPPLLRVALPVFGWRAENQAPATWLGDGGAALPESAAFDDLPERIQALLDALPPPLQPLDPSMIDGFLCAVLLQPQRPATATFLPMLLDGREDGEPPRLTSVPAEIGRSIESRLGQLDDAITRRTWFDPWVYELDDAASPSDAVLPWVAGFALAAQHFGGLLAVDSPQLLEPLALIYRHFDPDDLEEADALLEQIEQIEPAQDLSEAVEDIVRSVLLIADVVRPLRQPPTPRQPPAPRPRREPARGRRRGTL